MKKLILCGLMMISINAFATTYGQAVSANEILSAKFELSNSVERVAVLTNSLTPQGLQNKRIAAFNMADEITNALDQTISKSLNNGMSCDKINLMVLNHFDNDKPFQSKLVNDVQKEAGNKMIDDIINYTDAQCNFLLGK